MPKFVTKSGLFGYFSARILKNYSHIWNQHLQLGVIAKFCEETKIPKFGTKNVLFECFWARILKMLLSYLKSAPSNLSIWKISRKKKSCLNLGPKIPYLGVFRLVFSKSIVIFEISSFEFDQLQNFARKTKMPEMIWD